MKHCTKEAPAEERQVRIAIREKVDIAIVRKHVREIGRYAGFPVASIEALATAASEITSNMVVHAGRGEILVRVIKTKGRAGIEIVGSDEGPGIADPEQAMVDGYTTANSLGIGLSGAKRFVDEFELRSTVGKGTVVVMRKWLNDSRG